MKVYTELLPVTKSEKHGALTWEPAADNATSHVAGVLTLTGKRNHCRYRVSEYPADMPGRAFLLQKIDPGTDTSETHYACFLGTSGAKLCDCKGYASTGGCRHIAALSELVQAKQL